MNTSLCTLPDAPLGCVLRAEKIDKKVAELQYIAFEGPLENAGENTHVSLAAKAGIREVMKTSPAPRLEARKKDALDETVLPPVCCGKAEIALEASLLKQVKTARNEPSMPMLL